MISPGMGVHGKGLGISSASGDRFGLVVHELKRVFLANVSL